MVMTGIYDSILKDDSGFNTVISLGVYDSRVENFYGLSKGETLSKLSLTFECDDN